MTRSYCMPTQTCWKTVIIFSNSVGKAHKANKIYSGGNLRRRQNEDLLSLVFFVVLPVVVLCFFGCVVHEKGLFWWWNKQNQPIFSQFPVHFISALFHFIVAMLIIVSSAKHLKAQKLNLCVQWYDTLEWY